MGTCPAPPTCQAASDEMAWSGLRSGALSPMGSCTAMPVLEDGIRRRPECPAAVDGWRQSGELHGGFSSGRSRSLKRYARQLLRRLPEFGRAGFVPRLRHDPGRSRRPFQLTEAARTIISAAFGLRGGCCKQRRQRAAFSGLTEQRRGKLAGKCEAVRRPARSQTARYAPTPDARRC
jgi:hypothetical protein